MADQLRMMFDFSTWDISTVDVGVLVGYFLLMMVVGYICRKTSSNVSDYIRMGCKSTWWLMGLSIFMQAISALTFTGSCGRAYVAGWSMLLATIGGVAGLLFQAMFFAPLLRRTRAVTPADVIRERFGPTVEQIFVYIGAFVGTFWGGMMLFGLATFLSAIFNVPVMTVILFAGVIVVFYSVSGGSWSVQITDSLQSFIMLPICLVVAFLSLKAVGGFGGLLEAIEANGLAEDFKMVMGPNHKYTSTATKVGAGFFTAPWFFMSFIGQFVQSANVTSCHRYLSTKSDGAARKAALLAAGLVMLGAFVWFIPPMVARIKFADQVAALKAPAPASSENVAAGEGADGRSENAPTTLSRASLGNAADGAYAIAAKELLPPGLLGLVIIAMFAATMSSMDSALTGTAGLVTKNIYPPLARRMGLVPVEGKKLLRLTQVVNLLLGIWAMAMSVMIYYGAKDTSIYELGFNVVIIIGSPSILAFALSLWVRKLPRWAPLVGMGCGFTCSAIFVFTGRISDAMPDVQWLASFADSVRSLPYHKKSMIILPTILGSTLLTCLFWPKNDKAYHAKVDAFFTKLRTPVDFEKEVGEDSDHSLLTMVGGLGLIMAACIATLVFWAKDEAGAYSLDGVCAILFVAGFIATISAIMYIAGRRGKVKKTLAAEIVIESALAADD